MGEPNGSIATVISNLVNLIGKSDISAGLQRNVVTVEAGKPVEGKPLTQIPCVLVTASEYKDIWSTLGKGDSGGGRDITYTIDVYAATNSGMGQTFAEVLNENIVLTDNLLDLFRTKFDLSMSGFWVDEIAVTMDEEIADSVFQKTSHIVLSGHEAI